MTTQTLHEEALKRAKNYRRSESELLEILIQIDEKKVYETLGYSSLHTYCVQALRLTDSHAYALTGVARKSSEVPELKSFIDQGELHLSNARRIVSVVTQENKKEWLEKAVTLSQRDLEREIVAAH